MTPPNRRTAFSAVQGIAAASLITVLMFTSGFRFGDDYAFELGFAAETNLPTQELGSFALVIPTIRYGLEIERFGSIEDWVLPKGINLSNFLLEMGAGREQARRLGRLAQEKLAGQALGGRGSAVVRHGDGSIAYLLVEIDELSYLRVDLANDLVTLQDADGISSEFETITLFFNGSVDSMLAANSIDAALAHRVRQALLKDMPLDRAFEAGLIKLIYTAKRDELDVVRGYGDVEAVRYVVEGRPRTTFRFTDDSLDVEGFFNSDGTPVERTWLSSPVAKGVISSPFQFERMHPVLQTMKAHKGTDFAADLGTPVLALTDGVVVARAGDGNNGNFVKIVHDQTYATQYLHLKGFARNLRPGKRVRKGEVIGYVGSTGLSTGPHVCLRFWKHDQQVDFQRELRRLPQMPSLSEAAMAVFEKKRAELNELLTPRA